MSSINILLIGLFLSLSAITTSQNLTQSIALLADELKSLFCDDLSVGDYKCGDGSYGIQDFVNSFSDNFESEVLDITEITQAIIDNLNNELNVRATFLTTLAYELEESCLAYGYGDLSSEAIPDFQYLKFSGNADRAANLPNDVAYSSVYGNSASLGYTTYKIPNNVDYQSDNIQKDAQISYLLESTMLDLHDKHCVDSNGNEEYCAMYFGTVNGVFRQYPGTESPKQNNIYSSYDPRFRPWYVSAASGMKDVVILIDRSGSMLEHERMELAKQAVISVLTTLGQSSFVSVVAFNDDATLSCFGEELVAATSKNVAELVSFVEGLSAKRGTNFEAAFNAAFDILENGAKSCQTSILFLTDGQADDVSELIERRNTDDINAVIFSYTLGSDADTTVPRKVAALTNGIYKHIDDDDSNLITAMSSYYLYYAYGARGGESDNIIVTSPYLDFDTGIAMITMAMAVYVNVTYFVGVVGIDIPLSFLSDAIGDITIGRKSYSFVVNQESEAILHPLIADPLTTLFTTGDTYNAVYIDDLEPAEFNTTLVTMRKSGMVKITANVKQAAGNVAYNGYIYETVELLYIYAGVGPSSLSIGIVIYTESGIAAPYIKGFGFFGSLIANDECTNDTLPFQCIAPFNLMDDIERVAECDSSWMEQAGIVSDGNGLHVSYKYPAWFLHAGGWSDSINFLNIEATCDEIEALHKLTNRIGIVQSSSLPYGGFRSEVSEKIENTIYSMAALAEFWRTAYFHSNSTFFRLYFGSYQGVSVTFPATAYKREYSCLLRPWYQRAVSYQDLFVFTTPYADSTTGLLVASGATSINAPDSVYPFGVVAFDYEFNVFLSFWNNIMANECDISAQQYCYLIDTSAFLLYYDDIESDINDDDISIKFFGDFEPTLFKSLLDIGFFVSNTNTNFLDNTIDISYHIDDDVYYEENLNLFPHSFQFNYGEYSVHMISDTNLYLIYISGYQRSANYPTDYIQSPGPLKSAAIDVCTKADAPAVSIDGSCSAISNFGICILKTDEESDICASNFNAGDCGPADNSNFLSFSYFVLFFTVWLLISQI